MTDEYVPQATRLLAKAILAELGRLLTADDEGDQTSVQVPPQPQPEPASSQPQPPRWSDNEWLNTKQAAAQAGRHTVTILRAAGVGELHGHQPGRNARWSFKEKSVDAWVEGRSSIAACGCQELGINRRRAR
jgi:hypothetical protein